MINQTDKTRKALQFAQRAHHGQKDDRGEDYMLHCCQVAELISVVLPLDESLICAAYLHDVIEDTQATYQNLQEEFGQEIADLVNEVSHEGKKDFIGFWFPRLISARGIILKFADRLSNLSRMDCWKEDRQKQYLKKSKFWNDGTDGAKKTERSEVNVKVEISTEEAINSIEGLVEDLKSSQEYCLEQNGLPHCKNCGMEFDKYLPKRK